MENEKCYDLKPIGVGIFGEIYDQFKGDEQNAISFLLMKKDGEAIGVLYHNDVGEISLVYGNDSYGLKKISSKHPEVLGLLQDILNESIVESKSCNRIVLISHSHKVIVSKMLRDKAVNPWILTAYKKKSASASSSDIETEP